MPPKGVLKTYDTVASIAYLEDKKIGIVPPIIEKKGSTELLSNILILTYHQEIEG